MLNRFMIFVVLSIWSNWLLASEATDYQVKLLANENDGSSTKIANLTLQPQADGFSYKLNMITTSPFSDHFLAMRPFRCLTEEQKKLSLCYLAYPYENKRFISKDDLTDLEYDLLFIRRNSNDYGINPWNGSYYRLEWQDAKIIGDLHEVDLDILAVPPEADNLRPINIGDLTAIEDANNYWFPKLLIEPLAE